MKHCHKCEKEYSDDSLQFCLIDGTPLLESYGSEETVRMNVQGGVSDFGIKFPIEMFRVYCLFGYETDCGRESILWNEPMAFHHVVRERGEAFRKRYESWKLTKRRLSRHELLDGQWLKVADKGQQHRLELHGDGTLTERSRFDEDDQWSGKWQLIDGILRLNINIHELDIVGSRDGLHSGVEDESDHRNAYFTVAHANKN